MTKPFRVEAQIAEATARLRSPQNWPVDFYDALRERNVEPLQSVLIDAIPDQNCLCIQLMDQRTQVVTFDLSYDGAPEAPAESAQSRIDSWRVRATAGEDWWWKEHPRMTEPKPNNPIGIALALLEKDS